MQRAARAVVLAPYVGAIEPARLTLNVLNADDLDEILRRVQARLDSEAGPQVVIDRLPTAVRFTSATWRPILITRVTDAMDAELGPDWNEQHFTMLG